MDTILARRFAPLNCLAIPGFPNPMPSFPECANFLPIFHGDEGDKLDQQLIDFHQCIDWLNICHDDALMKMFIYSLNGDARIWYQSLSISNISSMQKFHATFHKYCKRYYSYDIILEGCCEKFKYDIHQIKYFSSYAELSEDLDERESKDESAYFIKNMDKTLSLSYSREEGFQDIIDDSTDVCIAVDESYPIFDASYVYDLKEELIVEEDFSPFFQEVPHDVFSPVNEEKNPEIAHFSLQKKNVFDSPIFDEYSDEEEQTPTSYFVDLRSNQLVYDSYESEFDVEDRDQVVSLFSKVSEDVET